MKYCMRRSDVSKGGGCCVWRLNDDLHGPTIGAESGVFIRRPSSAGGVRSQKLRCRS